MGTPLSWAKTFNNFNHESYQIIVSTCGHRQAIGITGPLVVLRGSTTACSPSVHLRLLSLIM